MCIEKKLVVSLGEGLTKEVWMKYCHFDLKAIPLKEKWGGGGKTIVVGEVRIDKKQLNIS